MTLVELTADALHASADFALEYGKWSSALDELKLELAQSPTVFEEVAGCAGLRLAETRPFPELPVIRTWYVYDAAKDVCTIQRFFLGD